MTVGYFFEKRRSPPGGKKKLLMYFAILVERMRIKDQKFFNSFFQKRTLS